MKIYTYCLKFAGFLFQYVIPIILFGNVVPYTHGALTAGLTTIGYIALAVLIFIISGKIKDKLQSVPDSVIKAVILSVFPIMYWFIAKLGIDYLLNFVTKLAQYWGYVIIFIVIGRLLIIASELVKDNNKTVDKAVNNND